MCGLSTCVVFEEEFLSVLVRLRLNLSITDLPFRREISTELIATIFQKRLDVMFSYLLARSRHLATK
jgi:hypothetical protein